MHINTPATKMHMKSLGELSIKTLSRRGAKMAAILAAATWLTACGGSSSSDDDNNDNDNNSGTGSAVGEFATGLSYAATETAKNAVASENSPIGPPIAGGNSTSELLNLSLTGHKQLPNADRDEGYLNALGTETQTSTEQGTCGGEVRTLAVTTTPDEEGQFLPISIDSMIDYDDFCVGNDEFTIIFNGSSDFEWRQTSESLTYSYRYDLSYVSTLPSYPSGSFSASESCTAQSGEQEVCTSSSFYESAGGEEFTFTNVEVSGDSNQGFEVSGEIQDEDGNSYDVDISGFTQCDNGNVGSGSIDIIVNGDDIISVSFPNCNECVVTYQGVSETLPQS